MPPPPANGLGTVVAGAALMAAAEGGASVEPSSTELREKMSEAVKAIAKQSANVLLQSKKARWFRVCVRVCVRV